MDNALAFISGRLTRDVEVRATPTGKTVANIGVAVNRGKKDAKQVSFFDVTLWDTNDEVLARLTKGTAVDVRGELTQESWTDKEGNKRSKVVITARSVAFVFGTKSQRTEGDTAEEGNPAPAAAKADTVDISKVPTARSKQTTPAAKRAPAPAPATTTDEEIPF